MDAKDWTFLSVVTDGAELEIEGADVWWHEWRRLGIGTLEVPHPNYLRQRHNLSLFAMEPAGVTLLFCAGELSNNVWCFYVPAGGQPALELRGATVNERLYQTGLLDDFDRAIKADDRGRATDILIATGLGGDQASDSVDTILQNPETYGY
jgi:hypothetical protein